MLIDEIEYISMMCSDRKKIHFVMHLSDYLCCVTEMLFLHSVIFCEAVAIYGVIVAIILQTKLESVPSSLIYEPEALRAGYAIFASGIIVGFANLVCG